MRSVVGHAVLLAVALVAAFLVWTAKDSPEAERALVRVWDRDPAELTEVIFFSPERTVVVERRADQARSYLWATETVRPPAPVPTDSSAPPPAAPAPQVEQYPVSEQGSALLDRLAALSALRDLGKPDAEDLTAYGLVQARDTVKLRFRDGQERVLAAGRSVVGGGDRYVLDTTADRVYVLSIDLFQPMQFGGGSIRLSQLYGFRPEDVRTVVLRAGGAERVMERQATTEPPYAIWTEPGAGRADQTFGNFMEQLDRLWVDHYRPDVESDALVGIVRADYLDARGDTLGTLELFRARVPDSAAYFLRTRATIVPGEAYGPAAERIEQDVRTLFGGAARSPSQLAP